MGTTPEQRLARLIRHARIGWQRIQHDDAARTRAREWLRAHPSTLPGVDQLWFDCLEGRGPLCDWLGASAAPESWRHDLPLHSVLAGHPFTDLLRWTFQRT